MMDGWWMEGWWMDGGWMDGGWRMMDDGWMVDGGWRDGWWLDMYHRTVRQTGRDTEEQPLPHWCAHTTHTQHAQHTHTHTHTLLEYNAREKFTF